MSPTPCPESPARRFPKPITASALSTLMLVMVTLVGCSDGTEAADASHEGQVAYACALADHVQQEHSDPDTWSEFIGDDADSGVRETVSVGALLLAGERHVLSDRSDLVQHGNDLVDSVVRVDLDIMGSTLAQTVNDCSDIDGGEQTDVSQEGQLNYACAVVDHIGQDHGAVATWDSIDESPAWFEAAAASALSGAWVGQSLPEHPAVSEAGQDVVSGVNLMDAALVDDGLEAFRLACADD